MSDPGLLHADQMISVAVIVRLEGAGDFHADVVGLFLREFGELRSALGEVETRYFLVELLRDQVDLLFELLPGDLDLGEDLV